MKILDLSTV